MEKQRLAIFISGRGSNMDALLDACEQDNYPAKPVLVLSNRPDAEGLEKARARGIRAVAVDHTTFETREDFERAIEQELDVSRVRFIALAGFMRVLTPWLLSRWEARIINIHPSLLPSFPGLNTHKRALEAGCRVAGCSVHYVTPGVDEGPIIGQAVVPIVPDDTEDTLAARILKVEHQLYPLCLKAALSGNLLGQTILTDGEDDNATLISSP